MEIKVNFFENITFSEIYEHSMFAVIRTNKINPYLQTLTRGNINQQTLPNYDFSHTIRKKL